MVRKLILAATAVVALSAQAQALNTITTTQVGVTNNSSTTQINVFGSNTNVLSQFGGQNSNTASATQVTLTGTNRNTMFCLLYTSPSPRDRQKSRMPSSA